MAYQLATTVQQISNYLGSANIVAFDIETAPRDGYRDTEKAALDPHEAHIAGISFSVSEGTGIYVPMAHKAVQNINLNEIMPYLKTLLTDTGITKIAHNLAFEAAFFYAQGIVIQPPVYDTIAAAQMTLKSATEFRNLSDSGLKTLVPWRGARAVLSRNI